MRILKYPLEVTDEQEVTIPHPATVLSVQLQGDQICLWALTDPEGAPVKRIIRFFGTGHTIPSDEDFSYLGTVQEPPFVWHVLAKITK
jgi:hypothetical protein